ARRPPWLSGLALLGSVGPGCLMRIDPVLAAPVLGELIAFTTLHLGRPVVQWRTRSAVLAALAEADRPYGSCSGAAMRHRPLWRSFLLEQRALLAELPRINAALPQISTPTMVISGNQDSMIPSATPTGLLAAIGNSSGHRIQGGHDLQLGQPAEVAELIAGWAARRLGVVADPAVADPAVPDPAVADPAVPDPAAADPVGRPAAAEPA
ncbi:MAG: hypothetical protein QOE53_2306, partial [Pseudonocardiales bacterium]|nr:hypothetical protein [Pseudonocardiales bacterium]